MAGGATSQAQNEAYVRYGPQRFALKELIAQAIQTRDLALHAAAGSERAIQHAITLGRQDTLTNYAQGQQQTTGTRAMVDSALSKLGGAADPFAAAIAGERGAAQDRMTAGQTGALQELAQRRLEAASGSAYARTAAVKNYSTDIGKIGRTYEELAAEQGAFTQGRIADLKKQAADRQFQQDLAQMRNDTTIRGQNLTHQDRQAATNQRRDAANKRAKNGPQTIGKNGPKLATGAQHTALWQAIQSALPDARQNRKTGASYGETANELTNGVPASTITDPKRTDATGKPLKIHDPGIAKRGRLAALVAADYAYYGGITQRTLDILHSRGFSVRNLKLTRAPKKNPAAVGLQNAGIQGAKDIAGALGGLTKPKG